MVKTDFVVSKETEAQRLLSIGSAISNRFWQKKGFLLLPYDVGENFSGREVYFPDLPYPKSFWDEEAKIAKTNLMDIPVSENLSVVKQIEGIIPDQVPSTEKLKTSWKKVEKPFWQFCQTIFPDMANLTVVSLWITNYSRLCTFSVRDTSKPFSITAWVHFDQPASDIAEAVLSSLVRAKHLKQGFTWEESEAFVDNLLLNTKLNSLFPDYHPTILGLRGKNFGKYQSDAKNYFTKLGFPDKPVLAFYNNQIYKDTSPINNHLSPTESQILAKLVQLQGEILTFEQIGDILWGDNSLEKYSEYSITQTIHRLRQKILSLGISPEIIQTKRGEGYWMVN